MLGGIGDVLMASSDALMAYALYRVGQLGRLADMTGKAVIGLLEQLTKGVPATLTVKDGKGTITLGHGEDEDAGDAPEEELTDEEKRVKRMAEEYDELRGRYGRLRTSWCRTRTSSCRRTSARCSRVSTRRCTTIWMC